MHLLINDVLLSEEKADVAAASDADIHLCFDVNAIYISSTPH